MICEKRITSFAGSLASTRGSNCGGFGRLVGLVRKVIIAEPLIRQLSSVIKIILQPNPFKYLIFDT